ncbi:MAG TPA: hypothetical protein VK886_02850 [Vicinamibacterales bacterium]|nr:hypothetical protein [Vicinamibacterales bacterium]
MRTRASAGLLAIAVAVFWAGASAQEALPPARAIIDRFVEATGGREAIAKHSSRRALGRISMPAQGVEGNLELLAARPDLMRLRMSIPGVGEIQSGYDGKIGWSLNPLTGPMVLQGKSLEQMKADADFDASLHSDKQYKVLETVERTTFEGRPAYRVRAVRITGDEDFEFFDTETGLMLGSMVTRESPMGPVKATHVTSDYREFGGTKIASKIVQKLMGTEQIITITEVHFDAVDKAAFAPPPAIQALVK